MWTLCPSVRKTDTGARKADTGARKTDTGAGTKIGVGYWKGLWGGVLFVYFMCIVDKSQEIRLKCVKNGRTHFVRSDLFRLFLNCFMIILS